jgi:lysophospholipase
VAATHVAATRYGFLERTGARLRYAVWEARGATRGTVVMMPGRTEFIEKYATEAVGELLARGWSVMSMDWRGQGLSDRALADRDRGHIDDFATYIADFQFFLEQLVANATRPVMALCHSMGSHIVLRALAENGPGPFSAALFVAPMTGLRQERILRSLLAVVPAWARQEERYLPGTGPYGAAAKKFEGNVLTSEPRRFRFTEQWSIADPRLILGGPTIGWGRQAARSLSLIRTPGYLERIELPGLILSAAADMLVEPATHLAVARRMRHGEFLSIAGSRHEIMMETDAIRGRFWEAFDRMAKGTTG